MESILKIVFEITLLLFCKTIFSQNEKTLCKSVEHGNFDKVEHYIKKEIKKYRNGTIHINPNGGTFTTFESSLDSITKGLLNLPCVDDACWDRCEVKILIYPGFSSIGARFKTTKGMIEKCFIIQEGRTGQVKIFGWRPKLLKSKDILIFRKMFTCEGFIVTQKKNCE